MYLITAYISYLFISILRVQLLTADVYLFSLKIKFTKKHEKILLSRYLAVET